MMFLRIKAPFLKRERRVDVRDSREASTIVKALALMHDDPVFDELAYHFEHPEVRTDQSRGVGYNDEYTIQLTV